MLSTSASQREAGDRHGFGNRLARSGLAWIMLALLEGRRAWHDGSDGMASPASGFAQKRQNFRPSVFS